jgi:hypothetical protein
MRFLILAHAGDEMAVRVAATLLGRHSPTDVKLVSAGEIVFAPRWVHALGEGPVASWVTLHDGTVIGGESPALVFNRLRGVEMPQFAAASPADREYAVMEMLALVLSWLKSLVCPVINAPSPQGLGGQVRGALAWQLLAAKSGLPTLPLRLTSSSRRYHAPDLIFHPADSLGAALSAGGRLPPGNVPAQFAGPVGSAAMSVLIAGRRVVGRVPPELVNGCLELARRANTEILLAHFASAVDAPFGWVFTSADPMPVLTGPAETSAIVELLESRAAGAR